MRYHNETFYYVRHMSDGSIIAVNKETYLRIIHNQQGWDRAKRADYEAQERKRLANIQNLLKTDNVFGPLYENKH